MSLKKEEQSAAPDLVGKALATTARRQLSLSQTERVVVAAAASCATQRMVREDKCIVMPSDFGEILVYVHLNLSTVTEDRQVIRPSYMFTTDQLTFMIKTTCKFEFDSVLQDVPRAIIRPAFVRSLPSRCEIRMRKLCAEDPSNIRLTSPKAG